MHQLPIIQGRGAQINTDNPFSPYKKEQIFISEFENEARKTKFLTTHAKTIINKVNSPDVPYEYSMNAYQGCEHGCVYCYARNTHPYWGYSAGLDFESIILVKQNAPELLAKKITSKNWNGSPIMMSGNTDCYQPVERKLQITRRMLQVLHRYRNPVGLITKNQLILRDLDIISKLNDKRLVRVAISLNTLDDNLRQKLEPRAASVKSRLKTIKRLVDANIPVRVLIAPIIPGLTDHEIMPLIKKLGKMGVKSCSYIIVRLNGDVGPIFEDWIQKTFPDRAQKVLNQIAEAHGGKVNDSRFKMRMKGEGHFAENIKQQFQLACRKFLPEDDSIEDDFDYTLYQKLKNPQMSLF